MTATPLPPLPLSQARTRTSAKWGLYPADVLPLFVAETDFPLAPAVAAALHAATDRGDTGYLSPSSGIREAYSGFAERRFGWQVDPARVRSTCDVMMAIVELLRAQIGSGAGGVVVTTPVYPPFFHGIREAGGTPIDVPLLDTGTGWRLDVDGIEAALRAGARTVLLCNPHNPTGTVHAADDLRALARVARECGALVLSDEIHAPILHPGASFSPFLSVSEDAAEVGVALVSASKAFNLAGLKAALMVAASDTAEARIRALPAEVEWRTSLFGAIASVAAFSSPSDEWLDGMLATLDANRLLLADLLADRLPLARYRIPDAGFLAWIDLSAYGWGDDPAEQILAEARVALHHGLEFGPAGAGHVRLTFGCHPEVLREAVERIASLV